MSEKLLKFLLRELSVVRVVCHHANCKNVVETTIDRLDRVFAAGACPVCHQAYGTADEGHLLALAKAVRGLAGMKDRLDVEFVLPDKEATS